MIASLASPLVAVVVIAVIATSAHRRLPPRLAARFVTCALVLVVLAAVPTALMISVAFMAHVPVIGIGFEWCAQAIGVHGSVAPRFGLPVVALSVIGTVRTARLLRRHRAMCCDAPHSLHISNSDRPYAVTLPGRAGQIVISRAMLDMLDDDEQRIVIAHERAHARYRHDRYLVIAEFAAVAIPPLRTLAKRVSYSIERWADEAAAAACGDRELVAITLGKVALQTNVPTVAGFSGLGVASRMEALLAPPVPRPSRLHLVVLWGTVTVTAGLTAFQLHHLERLVAGLCPH